MDRKEKELTNLIKPEIKDMDGHRKRLKVALLLAHKNRSLLGKFGHIAGDIFKTMPTPQKTAALSLLAAVTLIIIAGIAGPSAPSVAYAEARETINRSFERIAVLSEEKRAFLEERFQERKLFRSEGHRGFMGIKEISPEEIETRLEQRKLSLAETLVEARNAPDLQVISAEEMPMSGFFARAGRTLGFKMMKHHGEDCPNLPEGICEHFEERVELHEEMKPVSFLIYTNSEGQRVTLGLNADDEPVITFVQPNEDVFSHGRQKMLWKFGKDE